MSHSISARIFGRMGGREGKRGWLAHLPRIEHVQTLIMINIDVPGQPAGARSLRRPGFGTSLPKTRWRRRRRRCRRRARLRGRLVGSLTWGRQESALLSVCDMCAYLTGSVPGVAMDMTVWIPWRTGLLPVDTCIQSWTSCIFD